MTNTDDIIIAIATRPPPSRILDTVPLLQVPLLRLG